MNQAVLSWVAPTTNTDGTPITGTLTYNVYQGLSPTITGLPDGATVYFTVTAVEGGVESAKSNVVSKVFPPATPDAPSGLTVS